MAAAFLCPGCMGHGDGPLDDRYPKLVNRHGDSTEPTTHVAVLAELQSKARLRTDKGGHVKAVDGTAAAGASRPSGLAPQGTGESTDGRRALEPGHRLGSRQPHQLIAVRHLPGQPGRWVMDQLVRLERQLIDLQG